MKSSLVVAVAAASAVLAGCGMKGADLGSCTDATTAASILQMVREQSLNAAQGDVSAKAEIERAWAVSLGKASIESVRTLSRDEKVNRYSCAALLKVAVPGYAFDRLAANVPAAAMIEVAGLKRDGDAVGAHIEFTSQPTDDGKQVFAELKGAAAIGTAIGVLLYGASAGPMPATVQAATATPPAAPASTAPAAGSPPAPTATAATPDDALCKDVDMSATPGIAECSARHHKAADDELNATYKRVMAGLAPDRKDALKQEQRAWIKERDRICEGEAAEFKGGTMEGITKTDCATKQTADRTKYLAGFK